MIKPIIKRSNGISAPGEMMGGNNKHTSLERLQTLLAMIWIENLTSTEKSNYCREIEKTNLYAHDVYAAQKLYDYYNLHKWPRALKILDRLKNKYLRDP